MLQTNIKKIFHHGTLHTSVVVLALFSFISVNEALMETTKQDDDRSRPHIVAVMAVKEPLRLLSEFRPWYKIPTVAGSQ